MPIFSDLTLQTQQMIMFPILHFFFKSRGAVYVVPLLQILGAA